MRTRPPLLRARPLIPCPAVEGPARPLFVRSTPLLEVERHVGVDALVSYRAHPVFVHRASAGIGGFSCRIIGLQCRRSRPVDRMMPVSRPAAGRQAVGVSWQVRREMVGVLVAYINEAVSPHWLRHAHNSHTIDPGATLPEVQATLGHASVSTTSGYLHARTDTSRAPRPGSVSSLRMRATVSDQRRALQI